MTPSRFAPGWRLDADAGPEWLFVRIVRESREAASEPPLAESVWMLAERRGLQRIVLELDGGLLLTSYLIGQVVLLHKRVLLSGGLVRMCGVSAHNYRVLEHMRFADRFPNYPNREAAVMGYASGD